MSLVSLYTVELNCDIEVWPWYVLVSSWKPNKIFQKIITRHSSRSTKIPWFARFWAAVTCTTASRLYWHAVPGKSLSCSGISYTGSSALMTSSGSNFWWQNRRWFNASSGMERKQRDGFIQSTQMFQKIKVRTKMLQAHNLLQALTIQGQTLLQVFQHKILIHDKLIINKLTKFGWCVGSGILLSK